MWWVLGVLRFSVFWTSSKWFAVDNLNSYLLATRPCNVRLWLLLILIRNRVAMTKLLKLGIPLIIDLAFLYYNNINRRSAYESYL